MLGGGAVRTLELGGLGVDEGQVLLADKQLSGTTEDWAALIARSGGNGLALKVVGESIREVFGGDIAAFLEQAGHHGLWWHPPPAGRADRAQLGRSRKRCCGCWLLSASRSHLGELIVELGPRVGRGAVLEAVEALAQALVSRAGRDGRCRRVHPAIRGA